MITEEDSYDPRRNSEELGILHDLPRTVMDDLEEFQYLLKKPFLTTRDTLHLTPYARADEPSKHAEVLKTHFRRASTALDSSIEKIPLINGFFDQKYFQSWFTTWDTLFTISIHRFMDVIDSIQ
ncbi:hypothetical protein H4Q26_009472 [Puccinia striiformis f. sp. tritici PST-130]|nr:hypothetical protein H4Q26_009472 [Puccinia striiformis f. sp. tritici PST-130]